MPAQQVDTDSDYALTECKFTAPEGKEFDKWLVTVGTAQEVEKLPDENVVASADITVKAMWRSVPAPGKVNIRFNANGGSGSMPTQQVDKDSSYKLPACGYTAPAGKEFDKWLVTVGTAQEVEKLPNENVVASADITVKAMWRNALAPNKVNIMFNANGGAGSMPTKQIDKDSDYTLPVCGYKIGRAHV